MLKAGGPEAPEAIDNWIHAWSDSLSAWGLVLWHRVSQGAIRKVVRSGSGVFRADSSNQPRLNLGPRLAELERRQLENMERPSRCWQAATALAARPGDGVDEVDRR